jgi:TRAP-type C4-dicarboxylate transport system permease small subunit
MAAEDPHESGPSEESAFVPVTKGERTRTIIDVAVEFVGVVLMAIICVTVFSTATGRYFFNRPLDWAEELCISLLPWLGMAGFYISCRKRDLIRFNILYERYSLSGKFVADTASAILAILCFGYLAYLSWRFMAAFGSDKLSYSGLPRGYVIAALPVGLLAVTLTFLSSYYARVRQRRNSS